MAIFATITVVAPLAEASGPGGGSLDFTGTAFLPTFPCQVGENCSGTFTGTANGLVSGIDGSNPWSAVVALGAINATYAYSDPCVGVDGAQINVLGIANGQGTIQMSLGGAPIGTYGAAVGAVATPYAVSELSITFGFDWSRVATTAAAVTSSDVWLKVLLPGGPTWVQVVDNAPGAIAATFAPTAGVPNCANPGPLPAVIAADFTIA